MLDIRAYMDERESPEHFVLAAAVATHSARRDFMERFASILGREGLTEFKAADCSYGREEFKGRNKDDRNALYREFLETITACSIHASAVVIDQTSYPPEGSALGPRFSKPWPFAFSQLPPVLLTRVPPRERVAFICDEQREFAAAAQ